MTRRRALFAGAVLGTLSLAAAASLRYLPRALGQNAAAARSPVVDDGSSLYRIPLALSADDERPFRFDRWQGRFVVVALIFTRCPAICPRLVSQLKAADRALPNALRDRVRFLLVSIDPEHDTFERLRAYRQRMGLDSERFALVRGAAGEVRTLAASLGFGYDTESGELPTHSKLVTLLDPLGRIALQRADLAAEPDVLAGTVASSQANAKGGIDAR